ncbi:MAG: DUF1844 domain-containing protein [Candidatus Tectomicrobia bacterium]|uniref:DUF1844 domain-containing protein n=1 Tax=Tectimicrobiota bacterium TaxID=2528274 RepID=A0A932HY85_UNCTE|nr:DUF1844 domain-containing protein [Candidatus Tectomicrobia bacterium]
MVEEEGKGFKVSDRRFAVRGYEEEEEAPPRPAEPERKEPPRAEELRPAPAPDPRQAPPKEAPAGARSREFEMLLAILQGNALAAMGVHPQTGERIGNPDPRNARMFVDMVKFVQEKMKGNLSAEEETLLEQVVADLQMLYVQQVGIG